MFTLNRSTAFSAMFALLLGSSSLIAPSFAADTPVDENAPVMAQNTTTEKNDRLEEKMDKHVEKRIKSLHDALKITKDQDAAWEKVAQTMRDNENSVVKLIEVRKENAKTMSAVDDIKSYQAIAQAHADGMTKFVAVFEPFYGSLTDAQKKNADNFFGKEQKHHWKHHDGDKSSAMKAPEASQ